jgi:hypothetical protein
MGYVTRQNGLRHTKKWVASYEKSPLAGRQIDDKSMINSSSY